MLQVSNHPSHISPISDEEKKILMEKIDAYRCFIHIKNPVLIDEIALCEEFE